MGVSTSVVFNRLPDVLAIINAGAVAVTEAGADAMIEDIRAELTEEGKSGKKYPGLPNQSSAPGEAPQDQFHGLIESVKKAPLDEVGIGVAVVAGEGDKEATIATYLEFGTPGGKMQHRPFMGPAAVPAEAAMVEATHAVKSELDSL